MRWLTTISHTTCTARNWSHICSQVLALHTYFSIKYRAQVNCVYLLCFSLFYSLPRVAFIKGLTWSWEYLYTVQPRQQKYVQRKHKNKKTTTVCYNLYAHNVCVYECTRQSGCAIVIWDHLYNYCVMNW